MYPMIYEDHLKDKPDILVEGTFKGYQFWILSYGTHPCAYVELPPKHPYYGKKIEEYFELPLDVHGGITFARDRLWNLAKDTSIIGWDYAHCEDYMPCLKELAPNLKKWTTNEIYEEIEDCINQLIEEQNDD